MEANLRSSPIRTLPVELLTAIFVLASGPIVLSSQKGKKDISPMDLLLVSRRWHGIALTTPLLWSSLDLDLDSCRNNNERVHQWTRLISVVLLRSKSLPLYLILKDEDFHNSNSETLPIHKQLILHCHRWRSISLRSSDSDSLLEHDIFSDVRGALASLRSLTLDCSSWASDQSVTVFENCPDLHHLETRQLWPGDINLPWHQLTSWISKAPILSYTAHMLSHCDNLETLILDELSCAPEVPENSSQVHCLTRTLHLSLLAAGENHQITYILDVIKAPTLTTLVIEGEVCNNNMIVSEIVPHIEQFLIHSARNLTFFSVKNLPFADMEIMSVLQLMPSLSTLILHVAPDSAYDTTNQTFLTRLGVQSSTERDDDTTDVNNLFLPQLTELELCFIDDGYSDWCYALVDAILSRWYSDRKDIARLKSLRLSTMPTDALEGTDIFDPLIALRDEGFRFELN